MEALRVAYQEQGQNFGTNKVKNFITYYKDKGFIEVEGMAKTRHAFYKYVPFEMMY